MFYSTPEGAVDFFALCTVCALGVIFGSRETSKIVAAMLVSFLFDRIAVNYSATTVDTVTISAFGSFLSVLVVVCWSGTLAAKSFASLFAVKVVCDFMMVIGVIEYGSANAVSAGVMFFQMLVILGGAIDGPTHGRLSGSIRSGLHFLFGGLGHFIGSVFPWR